MVQNIKYHHDLRLHFRLTALVAVNMYKGHSKPHPHPPLCATNGIKFCFAGVEWRSERVDAIDFASNNT